MPETLPAGLIAGLAAALLLLGAVCLLSAEASEAELSRRLRGLLRPGAQPPGRTARESVLGTIAGLGEALRDSALLAPGAAEGMGRLLLAMGRSPRRAVPLLLGAKAVLAMAFPALVVAQAVLREQSLAHSLVLAAPAAAIGLMLPNWVLVYAQRRYAQALRKGLPDALDLLVICAEAGLGLESALERVAAELRGSHAAVAVEFALLVQELRLRPDRQQALLRLGGRDGIEALQRLGATLAQTLRFGTPLGEALRLLAGEMRAERMLRIEEKALRLPALLVLPLILFILPCLFIVLAGPSVIQLAEVMVR